ncbi:uncharacterized protein TNCV_1996931 [Trichonephila clavipes]|uniref:Uncharacterized protein n=1 Tax=Trichonephila clavipes TaxID=2585209 RepID=A0A8X6UXW1_TRICX|nr:uncharacterized protein TNCV_1996931 [Trichonephila clavipes]
MNYDENAELYEARATIDLLKDTFRDRLISRFGPVNWPPISCDLTPLDYFLWGYVKSLVYADKAQTLDHLEDNIRRVIADIQPQMLEKVIENWTSRLDYIRASHGSPMPEIIFKSKYAKLDNFLIYATSSSCASASSSNARELDEQILEVKINPQEKNTVSDTSTNNDTLSKEKESENENEETKLIRNDFEHYVDTPIDADLREQILKLGPIPTRS